MPEVLTVIALGSYFGLLIALIYFLSKRVRLREHRKANGFFEEKLHMFFWVRQILFLFFPLILSLVILGFFKSGEQLLSILSDHFLSLIVLGLSVNVFWIIQLPLVSKANLVVDFSVDKIGDFDEDEITLTTDTKHVVYTRIYNAGYSNLKNCVILLYFQKGVEIIPSDESEYENYDFVKKFSVQKGQCGVLFDPLKNFQTIPPQEWFLFPVILRTQKSELEQYITLLFNSESSWGQTKHEAKMKINKK